MKELVLLIINNCVYWNVCVVRFARLFCPLRPSRGHIAFVLFQTWKLSHGIRFRRKLKPRCFEDKYLCKAAPLQARKKMT